MNSFSDKLQLRNEAKKDVTTIYRNKGIFAASRKELDYIAKQRAGSLTFIEFEIRKIKTELYNESQQRKELTYLNKRRNTLPSPSARPSSIASEKNLKQPKTQRISTRDAASMERQRLDRMVESIKTMALIKTAELESNNDSSCDQLEEMEPVVGSPRQDAQ